jgi:hypothetical protein
MSIETDHDPKTDFSKYRSFEFLPEPSRSSDNPVVEGALIRNRIWDAVKREMGAKGLGFKEAGGADLLIAYHADVTEKVDVTNYGYQYGRWGMGYAGASVDTYRYNEGRLILDLIDAQSRDLVWRGMATTIVGEARDPEKSTATINEAVSKILANYPPDPRTTN